MTSFSPRERNLVLWSECAELTKSAMSLFKELRRLSRKEKFETEDFHTEIVAQVLRNSKALTTAWLNGIKATTLQHPDYIGIGTQEEFAKLAGHAIDSRPDITIRMAKGDVVELILIESKVGAKQGPKQLQRYVEQLAAKTGFSHTTLVFVTRDFELPHSLSKLPPGVEFRQTRWFQFFHFLKAHVSGDGLARELKLFMEENRMSQQSIHRNRQPRAWKFPGRQKSHGRNALERRQR